MARIRQEITDFLTSMEQFEDTQEDLRQLQQSMEQSMIVLEGLEVSADELGTYMQSGKSSNKVDSKELLENATKWMNEADGISQGANDTAPISVNATTSWESISLEDMGEEEKKGFFRRLWDAIKRVVRAIWNAIVSFFGWNAKAAEVLERKTASVETELAKVTKDKPSTARVILPAAIVRSFGDAAGEVKHANAMVTTLQVSDHVLQELSQVYVKVAETTMSDVKGALDKAFETNFGPGKATDDLCLALATFDIRRLAGRLGNLETGSPSGVSIPAFRAEVASGDLDIWHSRELIGGSVLVLRAVKSGFFDRIRNLKPANRIRSICANDVVLTKLHIPTTGNVEADVLPLGVIRSIVPVAGTIVKGAKQSEAAMKSFKAVQDQLDAQIQKCIDEAEAHPEQYSRDTGHILSLISTVTAQRLTPMVRLQQQISYGAHALMDLCAHHLTFYR